MSLDPEQGSLDARMDLMHSTDCTEASGESEEQMAYCLIAST